MIQITQSVLSLKAYTAWYNSGQAQQTGLNVSPFTNLNSDCSVVLAQLSTINSGIEAIQKQWQQNSGHPVSTESTQLGFALNDLSTQAQSLITTATSVKSQSSILQAQVDAQIKTLQNEIQLAQNQYNQANTDYNNAINQYNSAENQLKGSSGFWNGFVTGITLGIDDRIKDEMDDASRARSAAANSMVSSQQAIANLNRSQSALNSCTGTLGELDDLMSAATEIQNSINTTLSSCQTAASDALNAGGTDSTVVAQTFMKLATSAVTSLFAVGSEINAAIGN